MKKIVAIMLVLVMVLGLCATAFAGYYPTVTINSASKNQWVRYGNKFTMKYKCNSGTGPFYRVNNVNGGYIWRAGFTVYAYKGSSRYSKLDDWDFTGKPTLKGKYKTSSYSVFTRPVSSYAVDKYKIKVTTYYKNTYGTYVGSWVKGKTKSTSLYLYR